MTVQRAAHADWVEVNGASIHYELSGQEGPCVVLFHEMGGSLHSWDDVVPLLALDQQVLRMDQRGAGQSEKLRGDLSVDTLVSDFAGVLAHVGIAGPVVLAGCAAGAVPALAFALRHPERAAGLLLMAPSIGMAPEKRASNAALAERLEREGMRVIVDRPESIARAYPAALQRAGLTMSQIRGARLANDPTSYAMTMRMLATLDLEREIGQIGCPMLVLAGRYDGTRPAEAVRPLAEAIAGAKFEIIDTGHAMPILTPALIAERLNGFVNALR